MGQLLEQREENILFVSSYFHFWQSEFKLHKFEFIFSKLSVGQKREQISTQ